MIPTKSEITCLLKIIETTSRIVLRRMMLLYSITLKKESSFTVLDKINYVMDQKIRLLMGGGLISVKSTN